MRYYAVPVPLVSWKRKSRVPNGTGTGTRADEKGPFIGANPNQPLSPGDWLYKTWAFVKSPYGGITVFTIIYKDIEENNLLVECNMESRSKKYGNSIETKMFKLTPNIKKELTYENIFMDCFDDVYSCWGNVYFRTR